MGCFASKPEPEGYSNNYSKHGTTNKDPSVKQAQQLPDFAANKAYKVLKLLGEGGSGETWLCRDLRSDCDVAIKFIQRPIPKVVLPMVFHEVKIQAALGEGHISLVQVKELILTPSHLGLAMEFVSGGNLTAYVMQKYDSTEDRNGLYMTEPEAAYFFKQFLDAVDYLHHNHVAHRDLKLDNIVLDNNTPPRIKLCDFGFAKNWDETSNSNMFTQIGTPVYMSPQVISSKQTKQGYDAQKADVWACGVLLFVMLLGMFPFDHEGNADPNSSQAHVEVWLQQIKGSWRENPRVAKFAAKLSDNCRDLLDKIFELDEGRRIDIPGIRSHPWFNQQLPAVYEQALAEIAAEQQQKQAGEQARHLHNKVRDVALQRLVDKAGTVHTPGLDDADVDRVWLGPESEPCKKTIDANGVVMGVLEEGEEGEDASKHGSRQGSARSKENGTTVPVAIDGGMNGSSS